MFVPKKIYIWQNSHDSAKLINTDIYWVKKSKPPNSDLHEEQPNIQPPEHKLAYKKINT